MNPKRAPLIEPRGPCARGASSVATIECLNECLEKFAMKLNSCLYAAGAAAMMIPLLAMSGCADMTHQEMAPLRVR